MRCAYPTPTSLPYTTPPDQSRPCNSHGSPHSHPFSSRPLPLDSSKKDASFGIQFDPLLNLYAGLVFYHITFTTFHSTTHHTFSPQPYQITHIYNSVVISPLFNLP